VTLNELGKDSAYPTILSAEKERKSLKYRIRMSLDQNAQKRILGKNIGTAMGTPDFVRRFSPKSTDRFVQKGQEIRCAGRIVVHVPPNFH
jgi:hypothetical protein